MIKIAEITKKIVLHFPKEIGNKPVISNLIKKHQLSFNILKAQVNPEEEGLMVIEFSGKEEDYNKGIEFLKKAGVKIQPLSKDIIRDEKLCTHCSACVAVCPTKALYIPDKKTMKVEFDNSKCIVCDACIDACPVKAMKVEF